MKYISEYRDREKAETLAGLIAREVQSPVTIMEVCGTHTMAMARFGIKKLLPEKVEMISGPGCPVCVSPGEYIDRAVALAKRKDVTICTFGDMMKVPGSSSSLTLERARGADVRVVYSTLEALGLAKKYQEREVVFIGIGFETTSPTIAASIVTAKNEGLRNYSVLTAMKLVPPALLALLAGPKKIDGFLLPGHVTSIIGTDSYKPVFEKHPVASAVAGFEPTDILDAILEITRQVSSGNPSLHNSYRRAVNAEGNVKARDMMQKVFCVCDASWRGIGKIPGSGLAIRDEFSEFDAAKKFQVEVEKTVEPTGCRCGEILCGLAKPPDCPLFGERCTPENPVGACMVSGEGTCAAYYRYESDWRHK